MTFNLPLSRWINHKHNQIPVRREDKEEHPAYHLQREMNHIFDDFFRSWDMPLVANSFAAAPFGNLHAATAVPRVDVHETAAQLRISAELPGMNEKDIDISLSKNRLTISGEKKQEADENVKGWHRTERSYGAFERTIALPCDVDHENCQASFKNGVLSITLNKTAESQSNPKRIQINKQ